MPGLPSWQVLQAAPSLRLCQQYLPHLCLFVLLGPGVDPILGTAIALRPNSHRSSICELLNSPNLLHQFMAAVLTQSHHRIHYQILIGRRH